LRSTQRWAPVAQLVKNYARHILWMGQEAKYSALRLLRDHLEKSSRGMQRIYSSKDETFNQVG
jgi:hypothetical protein